MVLECGLTDWLGWAEELIHFCDNIYGYFYCWEHVRVSSLLSSVSVYSMALASDQADRHRFHHHHHQHCCCTHRISPGRRGWWIRCRPSLSIAHLVRIQFGVVFISSRGAPWHVVDRVRATCPFSPWHRTVIWTVVRIEQCHSCWRRGCLCWWRALVPIPCRLDGWIQCDGIYAWYMSLFSPSRHINGFRRTVLRYSVERRIIIRSIISKIKSLLEGIPSRLDLTHV